MRKRGGDDSAKRMPELQAQERDEYGHQQESPKRGGRGEVHNFNYIYRAEGAVTLARCNCRNPSKRSSRK